MQFILHDVNRSISRVARKLEATALATDHMEPVFGIISQDMRNVEEQVFMSRGRRGGGSWARLKEDTAKRKGHREILVDKETLIDSLTREGAQHQILKFTKSGVEFGTNRPWAAVHQFGSRSRKIPARPFLRFTKYDERRWTKMIEDRLLWAFKQSSAGI